MITVRDFVELATDSVFRCVVYDLIKEDFVYIGFLSDIPEEYLDLELCSWDVACGKMCFNVEVE